MIAEKLIIFLKSKRDKKRQEVYRLRWEKAELEKKLETLKALKKSQDAEG